METFYDFIGRLFFSNQQDWERRRNAKTMTWVVVFSGALACALAKIIKVMYNHAH